MSDRTNAVLVDVEAERVSQDKKWGVQNHPNGTNSIYGPGARFAKEATQKSAEAGTLTWRHILDEEVQEAFAEEDVQKLREELVQVAAVAVAWIECIDRRTR